ncbi:hypothetical protein [Paraprevotella xylaniphila]|uniref:hypothetical protein n=1 Tax=Paraprevotella xylaniphila TaxID=454155 RepID=UPI003AB54422
MRGSASFFPAIPSLFRFFLLLISSLPFAFLGLLPPQFFFMTSLNLGGGAAPIPPMIKPIKEANANPAKGIHRNPPKVTPRQSNPTKANNKINAIGIIKTSYIKLNIIFHHPNI